MPHPGVPQATPRIYRVSQRSKQPLLDFMLGALRTCGCTILYASPPTEAPFRITFETAEGERLGIVAYQFLANHRVIRNRPPDEHRFQIKYEDKAPDRENRLEIWRDPLGLYTTLLVGVDPELGIFIGLDPVLNDNIRMHTMHGFKHHHAIAAAKDGWHSWERERKQSAEPVQVLVAGRPESFLRYIRFERDALGEDQGHRQLLAESALDAPTAQATLHQLAAELGMEEREVLDLIGSRSRVKMAVRGVIAEEHLRRRLVKVDGVTDCRLIGEKESADVALLFRGHPLRIECKNVLRKTSAAGEPRVDFQKTRTSKADDCSRYYARSDFHLVAACVHAVELEWNFRYALTKSLPEHRRCEGKIDNNLVVDASWFKKAEQALSAAVAP